MSNEEKNAVSNEVIQDINNDMKNDKVYKMNENRVKDVWMLQRKNDVQAVEWKSF